MKNFCKGIIVGIGGVAPGLSGSVLLIIFGLYEKTLFAIGHLLEDVKGHLRFLVPLLAGMGAGVLLFSRVLDHLLANFEMPTRYAFLGLILGTLPMLWQELRKNGFSRKYYAVIALAAAFGVWMFWFRHGSLPTVERPDLIQSVFLGVAVAATAIIPGVDPAVLLSTLGLYEAYVRALATLDLTILLPLLLGLALGAMAISRAMTALFSRCYTLTFSVIFGVFLTMIPHMLTGDCVPRADLTTAASLLTLVLGFALSWYLGDLERNRERLRRWLRRDRGEGERSC